MTEPSTRPAEPAQASDPAKPTPGEYLRKLREEKGHTHAVVGEALHLTVHYIKALEGDDYGKLPGLTFVKGYLRAYARFLGADEHTIVARFDAHIAGLLDAGEHTERVQRSRRRQDQALRWAIGAGLVVVAGLFAGWWFMSGEQTPAEVAAPGTATTPQAAVASAQTQAAAARPAVQNYTPTFGRAAPPPLAPAPANVADATSNSTEIVADGIVAATAGTAPTVAAITAAATTDSAVPPAQAQAETVGAATNAAVTITPEAGGARLVTLISVGEDELRVSFKGNSWIEVDDGRRVRLYNDMLRTGDTLAIRGEAPFHVLLGDARQVEVSVNATAIDISGDIRDDSTARLVLGVAAGEEEAPL